MSLNSHIYEKMTHLVVWVPDCSAQWGTCHSTGSRRGFYFREAPLLETGNKRLVERVAPMVTRQLLSEPCSHLSLRGTGRQTGGLIS